MSFWKKLFGKKKNGAPSVESKTISSQETYPRQIAEILAMSALVASDKLDKREMDKRVAAMKQSNATGREWKW